MHDRIAKSSPGVRALQADPISNQPRADRHRSCATHVQHRVCRPALNFLTIVLAAFMLVGCPGCSTEQIDRSIAQQQAAQAVDDRATAQINAEITALREAKDRLAVELAEARAQAKDTAAIEQRIAVAEQAAKERAAVAAEFAHDKIVREAVIAALQKQRDAAGDVVGQIGQGAQTAGRFLPAPWGEIIGAAGVLLAGISERQRRTDRGAAIEAIGTISTAIASGKITMSDEAGKQLKAAQSPAAKKLVAEAQQEYSGEMLIASPSPSPRPTTGA